MNQNIGCLLILALAAQYVQSTEVVCYFTNWAVYRSGIGKFQTSDIDPSLCTWIIYTFVGLWGDTGELRVLDSWSDIDLGNQAGVLGLKENNTDLKVSLAMGGWNEGSANYSKVAANANLRANFVSSVVAYLDKYGYDGFDLDWEYPGSRNGTEEDVENFITLLSELKIAFEPKGYLLSVAVSGAGEQVDISYNIPALSDVVDYIHLMLYDLRTASSVNYTAHHSPLYPSSQDVTAETRQLCVSAGIAQWLNGGANASKLTLGIPMYGRTFNLLDARKKSLYAPISGPAAAGPVTGEAGFFSYQEICYYYSNYTHVRNTAQQAPYAYQNTTWFSYDDERSVALKVQYALDKGLGGIMIWALDEDDFNGSCGNGKYPLLSAINNAIAEDARKKECVKICKQHCQNL